MEWVKDVLVQLVSGSVSGLNAPFVVGTNGVRLVENRVTLHKFRIRLNFVGR